jgi:GST-like protein
MALHQWRVAIQLRALLWSATHRNRRLQMADLSAFPITKRWPASNPDIIQLYSLPTPNGVKVSIALEELALPYEPHLISFGTNDQKSPEFMSLNPNGRIPAIIDPNGPDGKPIGLFESGAILVYLAEKTGKLIPQDAAGRYETLQWVFFQMGGIGPMFGQFGHFHKFAAEKVANNSYPVERYRDESKRLLGVLGERLQGRQWIMGDAYTIADITTFPWVRGADVFYGGRELLEYDKFPAVMDWLKRCIARPATEKGLNIPARPA